MAAAPTARSRAAAGCWRAGASTTAAGACWTRPGTCRTARCSAPGWGWVTAAPALLPGRQHGADRRRRRGSTTVTLPARRSLTGSVIDDGVDTGTPLAIQWSKTSGPGSVIVRRSGVARHDRHVLGGGTYVLTLTANDGEFSASDDVTIDGRRRGESGAGRERRVGSDDRAADRHACRCPAARPTTGCRAAPLSFQWSKVSGPGRGVVRATRRRLDVGDLRR